MPKICRFARVAVFSIAYWGVTTLLACGLEEAPLVPDVPVQFPAVRMSISPSNATLLMGEVAYFSAIVVDVQNRQVSTVVEWTSSNPGVASVGKSNGHVTALGVGSTTVYASSQGLLDSAQIVVLAYHPAARIVIMPSEELILPVGSGQRLTARSTDDQGRLTPAPIEWTSDDPSIAVIGRSDGQITAISPGATTLVATAGDARATMAVQVVPLNFLMQWASTASASSQITPDLWSATQATGAPNVDTCNNAQRAWLAASPDINWLELQYQTPVQPSELRVYESWGPASIVKVEVKDLAGAYHEVYTGSSQIAVSCMRTVVIPIKNFTEPVIGVRLTLDHRNAGDEGWGGIDAVRLLGYRIN